MQHVFVTQTHKIKKRSIVGTLPPVVTLEIVNMYKVSVAYDTDVSALKTIARTGSIKQILLHPDIKKVTKLFGKRKQKQANKR